MPHRSLTLTVGTLISAWGYILAEVEMPDDFHTWSGVAALAALVLNLVQQFRSGETERLRKLADDNKRRLDEADRRLNEADRRAAELEVQRNQLSHENLVKTKENLELSRELALSGFREVAIARGFLAPAPPAAPTPKPEDPAP